MTHKGQEHALAMQIHVLYAYIALFSLKSIVAPSVTWS